MKNKFFLFLLISTFSLGATAQEPAKKSAIANSPMLQQIQSIKDLADKIDLSAIKVETSQYGTKSSADVAKQNLQNLYTDYLKELTNQKSLNKKDAKLVKVIEDEMTLVKSKMNLGNKTK